MSAPYPVDLYPGCPCYSCDAKTWKRDEAGFPMARMSLCPRCGSKRCWGAIDHAKFETCKATSW